MYTASYKLNNSYTIYVVHDYGKNSEESYWYRKPGKPLEWKSGTNVRHSRYGKGVIKGISNNQVTVNFNDPKAIKKYRNIQVAFTFKKNPRDIDSLTLCY